VDDAGEAARLKKQARDDLKLIRRAAQALAEIDRSGGLGDEHADVLAALRIRIEGKERASLEDLLGAAGDISGKRELGDLMTGGEEKKSSEWPEIQEKKRNWPGL
jgi:hypothetical protein